MISNFLENLKQNSWVGISGSWRATNEQVEKDVRNTVREIIGLRFGIVTGSALNVDYFATDEALKHGYEKIKVFLPTTLEIYSRHYLKRAQEGVITKEQAMLLISQLEELKRRFPDSIIENTINAVVDKDTYYQRNTEVVNASDALVAFQVNESEGTGDTIEKAKAQGKLVEVFSYKI